MEQPLSRRLLDRVGYLPEERGLYKKMKIMENLVFLARLKGIAVRGGQAPRPCLAGAAGPWRAGADSKVEELSKGMQQKVQFIAAVIHEPDFMILDEPFSGLDPASSLVLKDVLLDLKKQGKTILFSTHRMDTVERLCDSICLVNQGRSVLLGVLREIKASYGRSSVQLEYEGELPLLTDRALVASSNDFGNYVELRLAAGADPQKLLEVAMRTAKIRKFELVEPSLEEIFIDTVDIHQGGDAMRKVLLIIRREYLVRVRTKAFVIFTVLMPLLVGAAFVLPSKLMLQNAGTKHIVIVAADSALANSIKSELAGSHASRR